MTVNVRYKKQLLDILERHVPQAKVYLFGSRARDSEVSGSDIDLALDMNEKIAFTTILKILNDIDETTIPLKVDLVDINSADEAVKNDILREGIIWKS